MELITSALSESRQSKILWQLAQEFKERPEIKEGNILCAILLVDEKHSLDEVSGVEDVFKKDLSNNQTICWVTDSQLDLSPHHHR